MNQPTGMEEVLEHEATIRRLLPKAKGQLRDNANRVMAGRPLAGSRLEQLRMIADDMKKAVGE
jgi:hypothetical protein